MVYLNETIQFQDLSVLVEHLLKQLKSKGYKDSTLAAYKCALKKVSTFMKERNITEYSPDVGILFLNVYLPNPTISNRWSKYIKTSIRRLNDYLLGKPYTVMQPAKSKKLPNLFLPEYETYVDYMIMHGFRPSTIETRKIYASQFLISLEVQGLTAISQLSADNIGQAFMVSGSKEGFCEKVPAFLKYLYESRKIELNFSSIVPRFSPSFKIPSVYSKEELIQLLNHIKCSSPIGKRDYAILALSVTYGLRAADIISLKLSDVDNERGLLKFVQSKTSAVYSVNLQSGVRIALDDYINNGRPNSDIPYIFLRSSAPYGQISKQSTWSIVYRHLMGSGIVIGKRKRGTHAIRSSLASFLVNNDVPYSVVQKILGHEDPNSTKHYVAIDIKRLRICALECPEPSGKFADYLMGGDWR